ncbi:MAG: sulfotransferase family protein, partial [Planktomarina sp.]
MPDPTLLICPGATKAGTSWLYRYLHDHSACQLRAVKELHYFDTFDGAEQGKKTAVLRNQVTNYQADRATAEASNIGWKVRNMDRRIADTQ